MTSPLRVLAQGLLAAAAAGVRARLRQAQTLQPLLQTRAGRERAQAALLDAGAALEAAQRIVQGAGPRCRARHCSVHARMHCGRTARTRQQARSVPRGSSGGCARRARPRPRQRRAPGGARDVPGRGGGQRPAAAARPGAPARRAGRAAHARLPAAAAGAGAARAACAVVLAASPASGRAAAQGNMPSNSAGRTFLASKSTGGGELLNMQEPTCRTGLPVTW